MTKHRPEGAPKDPSLDALGRKLDAARAGRATREGRDRDGPKAEEGIGLGLRITVELVSAIVIGAAIGYGLDTWLGTMPLLLLLMLILGFVAGILNVVRVAKDHDRRKAAEKAARTGNQIGK